RFTACTGAGSWSLHSAGSGTRSTAATPSTSGRSRPDRPIGATSGSGQDSAVTDSPGSHVRRDSLLSLRGFVVPSGLLLVFTPALLHSLGPEDYGLWMVSLSALGVMSVVEFGLGTTVGKYVAEYRSAGDLHALSATTSIAFALYFALGTTLTLPLFFLAP